MTPCQLGQGVPYSRGLLPPATLSGQRTLQYAVFFSRQLAEHFPCRGYVSEWNISNTPRPGPIYLLNLLLDVIPRERSVSLEI